MNYIFFTRYLYKFLRFVIFAIALTYFIGCLWYLVITLGAEGADEISFTDKYGLSNYSDTKNLVICCYFVMTTLTTVGYGDFTP